MSVAHIYIYGVVDYWQDNQANEWGYVNLKDVKNQLDAQKGAEEIVAHVHSIGGDVNEGFAIHDFIRSQGKKVTTIIEGSCYSIATVIALAGDVRQMTSNAEYMIHNPWMIAGGDAESFRKYAEQLEETEDQIAEFYASKTNLSKEEAIALMKDETFMTTAQAKEKGFITEEAITMMRAVAKLKIKDQNQNTMSKSQITNEQAEELQKGMSGLAKLMENFKALFKADEVKALVVQDANGVELDFFDLEEDATPAVGDKANVDGSAASGEHTMPSGETYVFADGALSEIKEAEEEEEMSEEMKNLKTENENLKSENENLKAEKKNLETEKQGLEKEKKSFQAVAKEAEEKFESMQSAFQGAGLDLDDPEGNKKGKGNKGKVKSRFTFSKD